MSASDIQWWLNLMSLVGIAVLAVPVWSLNFRRKKLQKVQDALSHDPASFRNEVKDILLDKGNRDITTWRPVDEVCLIVGYLLLLGSSVLRLFAPVA
ncbi:hypothetical protein [Nisaea sp.]|uniref:hypothetical protein n=1 Tax=Nisaea sp. TaxID=2024842 RepID=UPI002B2754EA|nr:hypothetical protein [Nisaea sp.]